MTDLTSESLTALSQADIETTLALPLALSKCTTQDEVNKLIAIQVQIHTKYVDRLYKRLSESDSKVKQAIRDLEAETERLKRNKSNLESAEKYIEAFSKILSLIIAIAPFIL
ncbi:hypothetical protein JCM15519_13440 [Fundidesulfovibrio butyratiphilus]